MTDEHLSIARGIIERMKRTQPTCDKCEHRSYSDGALDPVLVEGLLAAGWTHGVNRAGWIRRCEACTNGQMFSWAGKLDAERVADMLEHDPRCQHAFELRILEETLHS